MGRTEDDRMSETKLERSTPLICRQCGEGFECKNRNGKVKAFCSRRCKDRFGNAQRLKGAAILRAKKAAPRPRKASIRTLDQLSAAEGLPAGCYSAGSLGRLAGRSAGESTLADLIGAAKRMGLTEEGETLKAARLQAQPASPAQRGESSALSPQHSALSTSSTEAA